MYLIRRNDGPIYIARLVKSHTVDYGGSIGSMQYENVWIDHEGSLVPPPTAIYPLPPMTILKRIVT